ncbi:CatB-related O-acetyltransferase [Aureimonas sp. Leaf324]|jgi:virginiamycin A acetyltransferase|uniref:CatB-related O-acetyltransferase n=1 Tax=Aureimonas sp. Leaf324 TaxID=1736336 RepID=UPI0006F7B083|nr:CatB-related O-acetyltransferase [Aureimonas sp. Leaf324]KQQ78944.1 chloramphenicol acetyltransferase [Aureimonas sp. Leaf324]
MSLGPDPRAVHPVPAHQRIVFLRNVVTAPDVEIGEYTYYDDPDAALLFDTRNILHHYEFLGDKLVIGRFCAIATGARFVMNGANHAMTGFSTYPFNIFGGGWEVGFDFTTIAAGNKGDTTVGNDVWIGADALILPGVTIGDGAIIAASSVVSRDVAPYSIVAGNPASERRRRFEPEIVTRLLALRWWDWPIDRIGRNLAAIRGADIDALEKAA